MGQVQLFEDDTFSSLDLKLPNVEEMPLEQLLLFEYELLGFYLHEPPYYQKLKLLPDYVSVEISDLAEEHVGGKLTIGGVIVNVKKVFTKKTNREMAFLTISDGITTLELVVFPKIYDESKSFLQKDAVVIIDGRVEKRDEVISAIAENISLFDPQNFEKIAQAFEINVPAGTDVRVLNAVNKTLRQNPGSTKVSLLLPNGDRPKKMILPFKVFINPQLVFEIKQLLHQ